MTIEGIPEGYELARVGSPIVGVDWVVNRDGTAVLCEVEHYAKNWPIIRKIEKPKQYRPFANAAEAEPFWDRKLKYKAHNDSVLRICFLSSKGVHVSKYDYTYTEAFDLLECTDGTPFGIEVAE